MTKRKRTKRKTIIYKTLHRKHETHKNLEDPITDHKRLPFPERIMESNNAFLAH
jgi:hypothetical protein